MSQLSSFVSTWSLTVDQIDIWGHHRICSDRNLGIGTGHQIKLTATAQEQGEATPISTYLSLSNLTST